MTTTITSILLTNGFETRSENTLWWGIGSLVWGWIAEVRDLGGDLYEARYQHWFYDQWGDPVEDTDEVVVLHGARALEYLFERLPLWRYR